MDGRVVKLYQNVGSHLGGHYKSFRVSPLDTFGSLKRRALDKIGISRKESPFFSIIVKFQNVQVTARYRNSLRPDDQEVVCDVLNREEQYYEGEILLIFSDRRYELTQNGGHTRVLTNQMSGGDGTVPSFHYDLCTEFINQPQSRLGLDATKTIPNILLTELESITLKEGRVQMYQPVKDTWREVSVLLTADKLWITRPMDADFSLACIELDSTVVVEVRDDFAHVFAVTDSSRRVHSFRTKTRSEVYLWMEAIKNRGAACCENDVIAMAEDCCSRGESVAAARDVDLLVDCSSFEGTLTNSYMRRHFRSYLASAFAEESLLFWEHAEDFRRGHPDTLHPLAGDGRKSAGIIAGDGRKSAGIIAGDGSKVVAPADETTESDSSCAGGMQESAETARWARYIYDVFIADGSPMQIAIPGEQKVDIETKLTKTPSSNLFVQAQSQLLNHLKFHIFPSFVQSAGYRKLLQSAALHSTDTCEITQQEWVNVPSQMSPLLLSTPPKFFPSFFQPRTFRMTGAPYSTDALPVPDVGRDAGARKDSLDDVADTEGVSDVSRWPVARAVVGFFNRTSRTNGAALDQLTEKASVAELSSAADKYTTLLSGSLPTPWRHVPVQDRYDCPKWLPHYWWTHVDFSADIFCLHDSSYDENLLKMMPKWMKALMPSTMDTSGATARTAQDEEEEGVYSANRDSVSLENISAVEDMTACLLPTPVSMGIKFTSSGSSFDGDLTNRSSAFNNPSSWLHIPVPHISRSVAYSLQLPMKVIGGGVIRCAVMMCSYLGNAPMASGPNSPSSSSQFGSSPLDHDRDVSFFAADTTHSSSTTLSNAVGANRMVVFTSSVLNDGELRLFDMISQQLCAIIRLCNVSKVLPSQHLLNTIEIHDMSGCVWNLTPLGSYEHECSSGSKCWLELIASFCSSFVQTVLICHEGFLSKRGKFNTAFKRRWFVLTSEQKLWYYVKVENGQSRLKGEVEVTKIIDVVAIGKDLTVTADDRVWQLLADSDEDANFWQVVLGSLAVDRRSIALHDTVAL